MPEKAAYRRRRFLFRPPSMRGEHTIGHAIHASQAVPAAGTEITSEAEQAAAE